MSKGIRLKNQNNEKVYPCPYFPIGSIYLSVNDTNPSIWFGGIWEQISKGRTLIGVDTNDIDFSTVKKTGGEKNHALTINEMPSHKHLIYQDARGNGNKFAVTTSYADSVGNKIQNLAGANGLVSNLSPNSGDNAKGLINADYEGRGQVHNNMPPYFTCYIWCRIA